MPPTTTTKCPDPAKSGRRARQAIRADALQIFNKLGAQKRQAIALEITMLGRNGLDINDPDDKYTLKVLPGKFSGLNLLAIMYTAFRQVDPTMGTGADFSAGYQAALEIQQK